MLAWSFMFLVLALIMAVLGYTGVVSEPALIAKIIFWISIALFLVTLVPALRTSTRTRGRPGQRRSRLWVLATAFVVIGIAIVVIIGVYGTSFQGPARLVQTDQPAPQERPGGAAPPSRTPPPQPANPLEPPGGPGPTEPTAPATPQPSPSGQ
jgi:uncharacterized membrane protein YtjA (UPF0391 family)